MLMLISPAKTLDFTTPPITEQYDIPRFLEQSQELIDLARELSPADISALMKISDKLGVLNFERFHEWQTPFTLDNAKQAILAFKGDVYTGLDAQSMKTDDLNWVNQHLAILSGLYGLLRPLDLMQAYRLEMGTKFANSKGKNLYEFWGEQLTDSINEQLAKAKYPVLVNLASNEYYKAIQPKSIAANIITPVFKDEKNGNYKIISFYAKKARGLMARWIIDNRIEDYKDLIKFDVDGYFYDDEESTAKQFVFKREER